MDKPFDIRSYAAAWNTHAVDKIADFYSDDAELVALPNPEPYRGRDGVRRNVQETLRGIPDVNGDVTWIAQEGDKVAIRVHVTGTHSGPLELSPGRVIEPTNRRVDFVLTSLLDLDARGKIRRETQVADTTTLLMQVGVLAEEGARQPTGRSAR